MAKLLVAGESIDSESKETTPVRNPATGEVVDSVPKGTVADIRRVVNRRNALKNGPSWHLQARFYIAPGRAFDSSAGKGTPLCLPGAG